MLLSCPYDVMLAVELEMLLCRGSPSRLPGLVEARNGFSSAFPLLPKRVAGQDGSPEGCAGLEPERASDKHDSRVGEGEVHLHLDFLLLFTKHYFSGGLHSSRCFIAIVEQSKISLVHLYFFPFFLFSHKILIGVLELLFF